YLYNSNNTPYHCSDTADNPDPMDYPSTLGYRTVDNNRSHRLHTLLSAEDSITYERFKEIKYDRKFNDPIRTSYMDNLNDIRTLDPEKFPDIAPVIQVLKDWELGTEPDSKGATVMSLFLEYYLEGRNAQGLVWQVDHLSEDQFADILRDVQKHLKRKFRSVEVPLGEFQQHVRGKVSLPIGGCPDVLAAQYIEPHKKGRYRVMSGESFIMLVNFKADGTYVMEAVNAYGASANKKSPHYTDQMELYVNQQLRPVQLELEIVKAKAKTNYHPQ
ncbi:MAG: penicillin acylase family protein, partial [Bacteroidota bacterium]